MLQYLHVKNLALIDEIEVEFKAGLNIMSGETGAGKSIILGSILLALGGRFNKDMLRSGSDYGLVELGFSIENETQRSKLNAMEVWEEDGLIVLTRRLMNGRSISRINGETVQMGKLKTVASVLIDIHGQHEHQSLLYKNNHLKILDAFGKETLANMKEDVNQCYDAYLQAIEELEDMDIDETSRRKERDFLAYEIEEIQKADLQLQEDEKLETIYEKMMAAEKISGEVMEAYGYTASKESGNASAYISRALTGLSSVTDYDETIETLYNQLKEVDDLLNDFNRELSEYGQSMEFSEEDFYNTQQRLDEINRLKTKYGSSLDDIFTECEKKEKRLQVLEDFEENFEKKQQQVKQALVHYTKKAEELSRIRKREAKALEEKVTENLRELNFLDVNFRIQIKEKERPYRDGLDDVEYEISLNPGEPLKPLGEIASGGELSRIMLAIKTVMADRDEISTLIFDEIDVGISGRTAQKVSEKMSYIGRNHQVICITHLAQIAAMADAHYIIEKQFDGEKTVTSIRLLGAGEEIQELARILGGAQITDTTLKNAKEMKNLACKVKKEN